MKKIASQNRQLRFANLLTATGWQKDVLVGVDAAGLITSIGAIAQNALIEEVPGFALPGLINSHSHSFQYAMAGTAEYLGKANPQDDFWSWRESMYDLALSLNPDEIEAIAAFHYASLLEQGFTQVVEFHYLHHDDNGSPYSNRAEIAERLLLAALNAGIRLTLVPIFYHFSDFGRPPMPRQRRFHSASTEAYFQLCEAIENAVTKASVALPHSFSLGFGVHSLRAANSAQIHEIFASFRGRGPIHMHLAEQIKEVASCRDYLGATPAEWLEREGLLGPHLQIVHGTHLTAAELASVAQSGATIVICPSTEGNLGDGFFSLEKFLAAGGSWAIGTDSHIGLNAWEELRWLDYGARLRLQKRNVVAQSPGDDSGQLLFSGALSGGAKSAGKLPEALKISVGNPLDVCVYDHPLLEAQESERLLSTLVYASNSRWLTHVFIGGRTVVEAGQHRHQEKLRAKFLQTMQNRAP